MIVTVTSICIGIVIIVTALAIVTTSKAYSYVHKIDELPENEKENKNL